MSTKPDKDKHYSISLYGELKEKAPWLLNTLLRNNTTRDRRTDTEYRLMVAWGARGRGREGVGFLIIRAYYTKSVE